MKRSASLILGSAVLAMALMQVLGSGSSASLSTAFGVTAALMGVLALVIQLRAGDGSAPLFASLFLSLAAVPCAGIGLVAILQKTGWNAGDADSVAHVIGALAFFGALAAAVSFSRIFGNERGPVAPLHREGAWTWGGAVALAALSLIFAGGIGPTSALLPTLLCSFIVLHNFRRSYVAGSQLERGKILWLAAGIAATAFVLLLDIVILAMGALLTLDIPHELSTWLPVLGIWIGLAFFSIAILYRGALDPKLVVRRTVVVGVLAIALVFLFTVIEDIVTTVIVRRVGIKSNWGPWIAGGLAALAIGPLHERISHKLRARGIMNAEPADEVAPSLPPSS